MENAIHSVLQFAREIPHVVERIVEIRKTNAEFPLDPLLLSAVHEPIEAQTRVVHTR